MRFAASGVELEGDLHLPEGARGLVLFAHGTGSSRKSPRNRAVAADLNNAGFGTLLLDLLTEDEEFEERYTRHLRFDVAMLARRLVGVRESLPRELADLPAGYFGASTGAAAALVAAAMRPRGVAAVVSRGGRPDLAGPALAAVRAPTLLIVGSEDPIVEELNRQAFAQLRVEKELAIVRGATHLFEEPGALEEVSRLAVEWFGRHMQPGLHQELR
jgi:pimeloyl-ACP methyl ester carboxylesterase